MNKEKFINFIKKNLIAYITFFIIICSFSLIYAFLIYYNKIKVTDNNLYIHTMIIGIISFFVLGFISGFISKKNGLMSGLLSALIIILISLIFNLFLKNNFVMKNIIKIIFYLTSSTLGGIISVNIRK